MLWLDPLGFELMQLLAQNLAKRVFGHSVDKRDFLGPLEARKASPAEFPSLLRVRSLAWAQHDKRFDSLTPFDRGYADNRGFLDCRMTH
jgi:hypothetical protein